MHNVTDEELVRSIQSGNILSFERLVRKYQRRLFSFVRRYIRDTNDSEEIVQDAFVKVYSHIDNVNPDLKFSSYLFEIAKNTAFSFLRSHRTNQVSIDAVAEIETDARIYEKIVEKDESAHVHATLKKIDTKYRRILDLYYFQDLSYEEISQKEHLPINTVRTRIRRAKYLLKGIL